jgi:hypothetical protein
MREAADIRSVDPGVTSELGATEVHVSDQLTARPAPRAVQAARLSAAAIERRLGLPPGAWSRRHLVALRVVGAGFSFLGLKPGDHLIVEPGARTSAGTLVVVRTGEELGVRRVLRDGNRRVLLTPADPTELPFPAKLGRHAVIGTVLGTLSAGAQADASIGLQHIGSGAAMRATRRVEPDESFRGRQSYAPSGRHRREYGRRTGPIPRPERFRASLQAWRRWMEAAVFAAPSNPRASHWRALDARLQTLASCLHVTGPSPLQRALAREGEAVLRAMEREAKAVRPVSPNVLHKGPVAETGPSGQLSLVTASHPPVQGDLFKVSGVDRCAAGMVGAPRCGAGQKVRCDPKTS